MNSKTILYAVGAFAAAAALVALGRRAGVLPVSGDSERLAGVDALYGASAGQAKGVQQAVTANWRDLQASVFRTQPDFWV